MVAVVDADRARTAIDGEGGPLSDGVPQRPAGMRTEIREVEFLRCEERAVRYMHRVCAERLR